MKSDRAWEGARERNKRRGRGGKVERNGEEVRQDGGDGKERK